MTAAVPSAAEIMAAIKESGYLMEQEVATQLEQRGLNVRTNVAFEDPDEGKSREIDAVAVKRVAVDEDTRLAAFVEFIVECKNTKNPFVFIARPKNTYDNQKSPQEFLFPFEYEQRKELDGGRAFIRSVPAFSHLGFDRVFATHTSTWKAVQFCRIDRKGKEWHANHGGLYDAIFYPMAKAVVASKKHVPRPPRLGTGEWRYIWLFFPLVVTSGELFLIDSNLDEPTPVGVDHVSFQRELKSGKLSGSFMVTFVRQSALENFMTEVVDPLINLSIDLINNRQDFLKTTNLPWVD